MPIGLRTQQIDALSFSPPADTSYDLVVTHFFFDCLTQSELDDLTARLAPYLAPRALWLVSDFRIPSGPLRWPARVLVRSLYLAFRVITGLRATQLPNHVGALETAGFQRIEQELVPRRHSHHRALALQVARPLPRPG